MARWPARPEQCRGTGGAGNGAVDTAPRRSRPAAGYAGRGRHKRRDGPIHRLRSAAGRPRSGQPLPVRGTGANGGRPRPGKALRDRPRSPGSLRSVRAGAPPFHLRLPRRGDYGVGLSVGPAGPSEARASPRPRGRCQRAVCRVPGLARSGHPGRSARGDPRVQPDPPTSSRAQRSPGRHLLVRSRAGSLGHRRSRRLALGHGAVGRHHLQPMDRPHPRCNALVAHAGLFGGSHPGYGADHGCGARRRRGRRYRAQSRRPFRSPRWLSPACSQAC